MANTYDRVADLLVERLGVTREELSPEATFEELDLDSLDLVEFSMAARDEFGVQISDDEAEGLKTVGDAVALLDQKGAGVAGA
jgi:acyl carrier protein